MIRELADLPPGVTGFEVSDVVHTDDYRDVVLPAVQRAAKEGEIRFVIVIPDFGGMTGGAVWQDVKVGVEHFRDWKRIALVTDIDWMRHATELFGWMTPGTIKIFPLAQRDGAIAWAAGRDGPVE